MMRVLVCDDHPDVADITCTLLRILGHECLETMSGAAAIAEALQFCPHLVILDIGLPDVSGYDVCRQLRLLHRPMYIAAVTGWGYPVDRVKALAAGFDQHVLKPADFETYKSIVAAASQR